MAVHLRPLLCWSNVNLLLRDLLWTCANVSERDHDGLAVWPPAWALNRVEPTAPGELSVGTEPRLNLKTCDDASGGRRAAISTVAQTSTVATNLRRLINRNLHFSVNVR